MRRCPAVRPHRKWTLDRRNRVDAMVARSNPVASRMSASFIMHRKARIDWQLRILILGTFLSLAASVLLPALIVARISVAKSIFARPPYTPMFTSRGTTGAAARVSVTFNNYQAILHDSLYLRSYWVSLRTAAIVTLICLFLRYPPRIVHLPYKRGGAENTGADGRAAVQGLIVDSPVRMDNALRGDGRLTNLLRWAGLLHPHAVLRRARFVFNEVVCGVDGR